MFDCEREGKGVRRHIESAILKSITECSIGNGACHGGDAADVGPVVLQFEPVYVIGATREVGAQQNDLFTWPDLHNLEVTTGDADQA